MTADTMPPIYRFAPSPTGYLHIGNARTALWNALLAKKRGGTFILRFDDTDLERSRPEYAEAILEDLAWLGITPDRVEHQSARADRYVAGLEELKARGLAYACYETPEELEKKRKRLAARGLPPVYDRAGLKLTAEERAALEAEGRKPHYRFKLSGNTARWNDGVRGESHIETSSLSDPVLVRADGTFLYTFASVLDDIDMGVTDILRGEDHVSNTAVQLEIFAAFHAAPPRFAHHNLITTLSGEEMSKRKGTLSLRSFREEGMDPLAVALVAVLTGTALPVKEVESLEALAALLDEHIISRALTKFDPAEIRELSTRLLHHKPYGAVADRLAALGIAGEKAESFWLALRGNLHTLEEAKDWWAILFSQQHFGGDEAFLAAAASALPPAPFDELSWPTWTKAVSAATGRKGKELFMPLRLALTGREHGPELKAVLPLLSRDEVLARLGSARRS
ncbi:MAG: glutamate--tRNA ligase [Proteobacteria bacterium]|nr:glutamate--tRNA ligase [Pseudomonadota bacterium]